MIEMTASPTRTVSPICSVISVYLRRLLTAVLHILSGLRSSAEILLMPVLILRSLCEQNHATERLTILSVWSRPTKIEHRLARDDQGVYLRQRTPAKTMAVDYLSCRMERRFTIRNHGVLTVRTSPALPAYGCKSPRAVLQK